MKKFLLTTLISSSLLSSVNLHAYDCLAKAYKIREVCVNANQVCGTKAIVDCWFKLKACTWMLNKWHRKCDE